jgi:hypothetical protein
MPQAGASMRVVTCLRLLQIALAAVPVVPVVPVRPLPVRVLLVAASAEPESDCPGPCTGSLALPVRRQLLGLLV